MLMKPAAYVVCSQEMKNFETRSEALRDSMARSEKSMMLHECTMKHVSW